MPTLWTSNETAMTSRRTQEGSKLPLLIGHTLPMNHSCLQDQRCLESSSSHSLCAPPHLHHFQCKQEANKTLINVRNLAKDLEGNKKLCVRFGRLITAIVQHVGIDIPNYEPLPKPIPLDLHALQQIHFLNRWTKDPTKFCYEFPIGPTNTSLVLLPHEDIPSLRSAHSQSSTPPPRTPCSHTGMAANQALDRVSKLEKIVECQSRFISRLVRVVRHIAPERLFRPSSTAREPYEPDLGEFSLDSELGSEGDDPIEEEESSSHCHT
ncbi:unnamed protein product [Microthlaspi erraticum]|uniref:Uncharacterized protein n=1 Tax=Microthlaspi erraticum TaxID=1685480 RepID=A0A6D2K7R5_9BRAS|nr:unnamed protein product [Microthlaspi erraticum]